MPCLKSLLQLVNQWHICNDLACVQQECTQAEIEIKSRVEDLGHNTQVSMHSYKESMPGAERCSYYGNILW